MDLKSKIESLLFVSDRPITINGLEKTLNADKKEVQMALGELVEERSNSGVVIAENNGRYLLTTHPDNSDLIKEFLNAELREKLTEASLETLAIVAYKQPVTRAEIEAIRGVNSQYTLRLLTMRGLIEASKSKADSRANLYKTTHEFLQHMGLTNKKQLPDFEDLTSKVKPPEGFDFGEDEAKNTSEEETTEKNEKKQSKKPENTD